MMNWHDMNESGRERHAALINEARLQVQERAAALGTAQKSASLRTRLAELFFAWGRWLDGRPRRTTPRDGEREAATVR
jgi:hypothetical protein